MNERKIIDRKYLCDLAKEVGLTTLDLEALGENHHWEIVVEGNLLERMIETQRQFERKPVRQICIHAAVFSRSNQFLCITPIF